MAIRMQEVQFALKNCEIHDRKELHAYCKSCQKKICSSCIKENHSSHDWELIVEILRERRCNLPTECKEIRLKHITRLRKEIDLFDRNIGKADDDFERNKCSINQSRERYIDKINKLSDERIEECHKRSETAKQKYRENRDLFKRKVEHLEVMTTSLDLEINALPDHDIIDMEKEMRDELEKALSCNADEYSCTTVFTAEEMDPQILNDMMGHIHTGSLEKISETKEYSSVIVSIKAISNDKAFIKFDKDKHAKLISYSGEVLKVMKTRCFDLVILKHGDIVLTDYGRNFISVLTKDENEKTIIDTTPLYPSYVSKTANDDILVTLMDNGDHYDLVPNSRRIVQRMAFSGKVLHKYEFREDGKTRLFTWPTTTAENKNTDICVVNHLQKNEGELVVLNKDGRLKFTYRGNESEKFNSLDVMCDSKCHILLTEEHSQSIQMLSCEGIYLSKLCRYEDITPFMISSYGNTVWCAIWEGKVKVFRYIT